MSDLQHPSSIINQKYTDIIRNSAHKAEETGKFTKEQLALIHEQQWLKLLAPTKYGGLQTSLPDALEIEEALAWADGSVGWMVTLCAGAGWFGGFANEEVAKKIFEEAKVCLAGSGTTTGTAEKTKDGYTVTGKWAHASGANEATAFTANCVITESGKPMKGENNKDEVLSFLFMKNEVTIVPNWNMAGMVATGSHAYEVKNLKVPANRAFKINNEEPAVDAPIYDYPFMQLAEATLAVNISGMAIHFIDICKKWFGEKTNRQGELLMNDRNAQDTFDKYTQKMNDARTKLYYAAALSWQACTNSKQIKEAILYKVSSASFELAKRARECVDALYPYCGLDAADKNSEINRVWRDLHTASQHSLLVFGGSPE